MMRIFATLFVALLAVQAWAEVEIEEVTSPGGLKAWLVREPSIPLSLIHI